MSTEKKLKNIVAYISPSFFGTILSLISLPILTRALTPQDYGIIALLSSFPAFAVNLLTLNVQMGAERYYFEYRKDADSLSRLISTTITFMMIVFALSVPFVYFTRHIISSMVLGSSKYGFGVFISYLTACLGIPVSFYLILYRNMEEGKKFSFFTVVQMTLNTFLSLLLVVAFHFGYMGMVYATFLATLIVFAILFWRFQKRYPFCFDFKMLKENLIYGVPLLPQNFTSFIYDFLDKFLLRSITSLSSAGIYSIGLNIAKKFTVLMTAIQATYYPAFMQDMFDRGKKAAASVGRNFTIFSYLSLFPILIMTVFGEEIVHILAPRSYDGAIMVLLIFLCAASTQTFGKITGVQLAYVKKAYLNFPLSIIQLVMMVLLNLLLIPLWGPIGAGLAATISLIIANTLCVVICQSYYKIIYEKRILSLMYMDMFITAIALIYFQIIGAPLLLKYGVKFAALILFVFIGNRANIINKRNLKAVINVLTFKKPPVPAEALGTIQEETSL